MPKSGERAIKSDSWGCRTGSKKRKRKRKRTPGQYNSIYVVGGYHGKRGVPGSRMTSRGSEGVPRTINADHDYYRVEVGGVETV